MREKRDRAETIAAVLGMCAVVALIAGGVYRLVTPPVTVTDPVIVLQSTAVDRATTTPEHATGTVESLPTITYLEVVESCGPQFDGDCVIVRAGPGTEHGAVTRLRTGALLVSDGLIHATSGAWYRVRFDEHLRYPERLTTEWYISADLVREVVDVGDVVLDPLVGATSSKRIMVDRSDQILRAYDGDELVYEYAVSTGLSSTPTPRGWFRVFKKMPSRYMQGPIYGLTAKYYDLPGVPWNLYFTEQGAVIHGTYWHDKFGQPYSNGCVNLAPDEARELYHWADIGTHVVVQD